MPLNIFCSLPSLERKEEEERKGKREGRKGGREEEKASHLFPLPL